MKTIAIAAALALGSLGVASMQDGTDSAGMPEMPSMSSATDEHEWLQQLAGEWSCVAEASMDPGTEPMKMESTEKVRAVGDYWIQAESSAEFAGMPFTSILTLGYDPEKERFVGSWIDTMQTHMWTYEGSLDRETDTLVLETEGPSFGDPTKMAMYRETLQVKSADHKVFTSSVQGDDGEYTTFLTAEYRRKK